MVIYNVTSNMAQSIEEEWLEWTREHIAQVLGTGLFMDARLTRVLVEEQDGSSTFSIQYKATSREALELYYEKYDDAMRKKEVARFGEQVLSFRTELDMIDEYRVTGNMN
ncbi:protein of unknown function [Nonlabens sp. Hel1_33_55]|uniref:DUF4286 family protein n=1 Tax=Nonlabens sp. Hel1_33_55 TaxID=1336802 RepID=UPI000875E7A4|nr:DUF4286 family protein [Nonlabens sp. Hel1_33_55]SCY42278.1 protein of unknown function [Nonlabens sp. Hel1_33_55]